MNRDIESLNPKSVWRHFAQILKCPRPSHSEKAIRDYIISFAKSNNLEYSEDRAHNIYIRKGATKGMEQRKGIIMQSHVDMVPQKNGDKEFDFLTDAIDAYIDGGWVKANGTTLGADNGVGVAAILAILEDESIKHGELEAIFTASEEVGMRGAFGLKGDTLKGDVMFNLDSEVEGELCVGCAGGIDFVAEYEYKRVKSPKRGHRAYRIDIKGLKGGHSGMEISLQRANANKLMFRLLRSSDIDFQIAWVDCGGLRNAIPREASVAVVFPMDDLGLFEAEVELFEETVISEYQGVEDNISVTYEKIDMPDYIIEDEVSSSLVWAVAAAFDGVAAYSNTMHGLVQTSSNLARVISEDGIIKVEALLRSSTRSQKQALCEQLMSAFELSDAEVTLSGEYDGWVPNMDSAILKSMVQSYSELYGKEPKIKAVHAGLECGVIGAKYPELDMISFGPTIKHPHSPDEMIEIESVDKFYALLVHAVENVATK